MKLLLPYISNAINRYLRLDPESKTRLTLLQGRIASIELLPLGLIFQMHFTDTGVEITEETSATPDTIIRGTPLQMMSMMLSKDRQRFFADDVSIEGSAELGQQIIELFDGMQIDWEEYFARIAGDGPAHQAGNMVHKLRSFLRRSKDNLRQNVTDYLHEEKTWFPAREALQDLFLDIDTFRMDIDRLEARINHLANEYKDQS